MSTVHWDHTIRFNNGLIALNIENIMELSIMNHEKLIVYTAQSVKRGRGCQICLISNMTNTNTSSTRERANLLSGHSCSTWIIFMPLTHCGAYITYYAMIVVNV